MDIKALAALTLASPGNSKRKSTVDRVWGRGISSEGGAGGYRRQGLAGGGGVKGLGVEWGVEEEAPKRKFFESHRSFIDFFIHSVMRSPGILPLHVTKIKTRIHWIHIHNSFNFKNIAITFRLRTITHIHTHTHAIIELGCAARASEIDHCLFLRLFLRVSLFFVVLFFWRDATRHARRHAGESVALRQTSRCAACLV